ncbi:MAG: UDP-N-acetylmuramoyl-tripeptide--D-alanyl-D-alanine ligase [Lachnospiraceae bacterium]|nr:UDP-N-acetylmuramoyl-tripeptide--D-alanyl-D-alanine ligase [Lachnospiraceae bacterium]
MKNMTLARMAEACGGIYYGRDEDRDREICSVTTDSRKAEPGCLFAAIKGERVDGHDFIESVFEKGALCALVETPPRESAGNYIKVDSTIRALGALAAYYLEQLAIPVVGVTGSVGKTSTKEMIAAVLSQKYRTLKTAGNFNNELGLPLTIFRLRDEDEIAVLEMGINHFGEMHRLARIAQPDTCVITNIGQCHLEFLGDRDGVLRAKTEIFDFLRPDGHIILNGDDDKLVTVREVKVANTSPRRLSSLSHRPELNACHWQDAPAAGRADDEENAAQPVDAADCTDEGKNAVLRPVFFGLGTENDIYADQIEKKGLDGIECRIHAASGGSFKVLIPIPGIHMVQNALAATAVGLQYGLSMDEIRAGIESLQPVSGRFHIIHTENFTIIDDCYNANPMSMKASLEVLEEASPRVRPMLNDGHWQEAPAAGRADKERNAAHLVGAVETPPRVRSAAGRADKERNASHLVGAVDGWNRRVAILGDMGELGGEEEQMHREVGEFAGRLEIDLCICVGKLSAQIAEGIHAVNPEKRTVVLPDLPALLETLPSLVEKGDTILIKASHFMQFEKVVARLENEKEWGNNHVHDSGTR